MGITDIPPAPLKPTFDRERCPFVAKQLAEDRLTEAQRRSLAAGRLISSSQGSGSKQVQRDQPRPVYRPSPSLARGPAATAHAAAMWADDRAARKLWFIASRRAQEAEQRQRSREER